MEDSKRPAYEPAIRDRGPRDSGLLPCRPAARIIGPVAVEPDHTPFDALAKSGKAAILDDGIMHGPGLAVVQHDIGSAVAAGNIVRTPGPERGFVDAGIAGDLQRGIPEGALLLLELRGD